MHSTRKATLLCTFGVFLPLLALTGCGGGSSSTGTTHQQDPTLASVSESAPNPASISPGGTSALSCSATLSDGTSVPAPVPCTFTSSDTTIVTISGATATGVAAGTATITASYTYLGVTKTATQTLTVTSASAAALASVSEAAPNPASIAVGGKTTFSCSGKLTDGTSVPNPSCTYTATPSGIVTISGATGTGAAAGTAQVTATMTYNGVTMSSSAQTLTVTAASAATLKTVTESAPNPASIPVGSTSKLACSGTLTDNTVVQPTCVYNYNVPGIVTISGATATGVAAGTVQITATGTYGGMSVNSAPQTLTITAPTSITLSTPPAIYWTTTCAGIIPVPITQTGIQQGDHLTVTPGETSTFNTAPSSTFDEAFLLNSTGSNLCSPGDYTVQDTNPSTGKQSNILDIPILQTINQYAGTDGTDEYTLDYAAQKIWKHNAATGASDGSIPIGSNLAVIDGPYVVTATPGSFDVVWWKTADGSSVNAFLRQTDSVTDLGSKNQIAAYFGSNKSTGQQFITAVPEVGPTQNATATDVNLTSGAMGQGTVTKGCNAATNVVVAVGLDLTVPRAVTATFTATNGVATASNQGSVLLTGIAPSSEVTSTPLATLAGWDANCQILVFAPNSQGEMGAVLLNVTPGKETVLGADINLGISTGVGAGEAVDPAGNRAALWTTDESGGVADLILLTWTVSGGEATFTEKFLNNTSPQHEYCSAFGIATPGGPVTCAQRTAFNHIAVQ